MVKKIGIIGAGAWGTALATVACHAGNGAANKVLLQTRNDNVARDINHRHQNPDYLPGIDLNPSITATTNQGEATDSDAVLIVTPSQHLRAGLEYLAPHWKPGVPAIICSKGIEQGSNLLMSEIAGELLPTAPICILSGPNFASEVAARLPTAATLATPLKSPLESSDPDLGKTLSDMLSTPYFRIYSSHDLIGAQIGGAVKNVLAIACGIIEGRGLGHNARAALITRGLAEILRLGIRKGAQAETLMGLSGIGDLTLTCNALQSRNFSLGVALGQGRSLKDVTGERHTIAEGIFTASSVIGLARELEVEMPLCAAVNAVINHGQNIDTAIRELLERPLKPETH